MAEGRGGSRWTDRIIELADEIDAADLRGDGRIQQACVKLREVARSFPVGEPDDLAPARSFLYGIGHQGECVLLCECGLQEARAAVAAVRAAGTSFTDDELAFIGAVVHEHEPGLNEEGAALRASIKNKCLPASQRVCAEDYVGAPEEERLDA